MFDTVSDITKAVSQSEQDQHALYTRMDEDQDYAVGKEYTTLAGYEAFTSTKPQNYIDKILDGMNRAELGISIRLADDAKEKDREKADTGELFIFGALNDIDQTQMAAGEPPLRQSLAYYIASRGWYCLKCVVYVVKGETYFDVQAWDPMRVTYDKGPRGLLWIANKWLATEAQIKAAYGIEPTGHGGTSQHPGHTVIDFFDEERNAVLIDNEFVKKPTAFKRNGIPVLHGAVGSMPTIRDMDHSTMLEYRGQSVFSAAKHTFEPMNKYISQLMDINKKSVVGSLVHQSKMGTKEIVGDPWEAFRIIRVEEGESLRPLELPLVPEVTLALLGILNTEGEQSMLPHLAFGDVGSPPPSGRALVILADARRSVFNPRTEALSRCYVWLGKQLLAQYADHGKKGQFQGYRFDEDKGFFSQQIRPKDIDKGWYVTAKVEPKFPRDIESDIAAAIQAVTPVGAGGQSLVSFFTARDKIMNLPNPDAEERKVLAEFGENLEPMKIMNMAEALVNAGKPEAAQKLMALLNQQGAPGAGGAAPPGGQPPQIPPEVIDQIAQVFIEAGQEDLGMAVLEALGVQLPAPPAAAPPVQY